eukprot:CAMPEP_0118916784 /NCGR_PEP_ID=MMETSP1166-20130328/16710_1 /TAXON_ID=1104430 /ORGANISM="Chrysoreinhardia sp, Strain CCMP3193" /LENGTH=61 /DNA_ID=CAMNT_0006856701 /DNA_START=108 /DNA_END=293 /DNA_ORIENTATION=+
MSRAARDRDEAGTGRRVIALAPSVAAPCNHRSIGAQTHAVFRIARNRDDAGTSRRVIALAT